MLDWLWTASAHASRRWALAVRLGDACSGGVAAHFDILARLVRQPAAGAAWLARGSIHQLLQATPAKSINTASQSEQPRHGEQFKASSR